MKLEELKLITKVLKLSKVKPNPDNPRFIRDEEYNKLVNSITKSSWMLFLRPIIVNDDMTVLGGNMRLRACKEAGLKEAPVIKASELTEEQQKEFIIRDNIGFGQWDYDILANEWDVEKLNDYGLEIPNLDIEEAEEDNYTEPDDLKVDVVLGDLIEIGEHRLLCGDSTCSDTVAKLMDSKKAELLFTSPPYSNMREYNGKKDLSIDNIIEFIPAFLPYAEYQVINLGIQRKEGEIYRYWDNYISKAIECGYKLLSWNIWNRENAGFSIGNITSMFATQHEWVFVFGIKSKKLNLTIENKKTGSNNKKAANRQKDGSVKGKKYPIIRDKRQLGTINTINPQLARDEVKHPAMFPVELASEYIKAITDVNQITSDSFLGSGTTMVAAHQLKRKCYGMELDPKYCQVIIDRMQKLDEKLEVKINGKSYGK